MFRISSKSLRTTIFHQIIKLFSKGIYCVLIGHSEVLHHMLFLLADYHIVADGYGGKGYLIGREDELRLDDIIKKAQQECREGRATLLNVLIGKTNFREGSISV